MIFCGCKFTTEKTTHQNKNFKLFHLHTKKLIIYSRLRSVPSIDIKYI